MYMINKYGSFIKNLRQKRGFSQLEIADKIGLSRPTYIAVEQGKKDLSFSEAEKLVGILGVSIEEMQSGIVPNYEKYKQMILAYLRCGPDVRSGVPKTKLAKLLYLADFAWFYEHLESMSGMQYRKLQYGPVPDSYFRAVDELYESGQINIDPTKEGAMLISETDVGKNTLLSQITKDEQKLISDVCEKWKDKRTQEIVAFTHEQLPYSLCRDSEIIPYELITQEDPEKVF